MGVFLNRGEWFFQPIDFLKDTSERFVVIDMLWLVLPKLGGRSDVYVFQHRVANLFPCSISSQGNKKPSRCIKHTVRMDGLHAGYQNIDYRRYNCVKRVYMRWIRLLIHLFHLYINNIFIHLNYYYKKKDILFILLFFCQVY